MVSLTEYAVHTKVMTVVMIQIKTNCHNTLFSTSIYEIMDTVDGMKKNAIFCRKKSDAVSICRILTKPRNRHRKRIIIASTFPGKGNGRK